MDPKDRANDERPSRDEAVSWEQPRIVEQGRIEAKLFSDEPDPFAP